ncbi:MAG: excinuclease ABC subunit UvrA [Myxococcales bacterium]|jgi:excinuclease ABC subunit A
MASQITIRGARLHNLKNVSLSIPKNKLVVLTGLSGSGKSTLGFDILLKEGQRQYHELLGFVSPWLSKPPVDSLSGLMPAVSIDQHLTNRSPRSTVGTTTNIYSWLRVLFARLGRRPCSACGNEIAPSFVASDAEWERASPVEEGDDAPDETLPCPHCGAPVVKLGMEHFSFNKVEGACPTCTGLGTVLQADLSRLVDEEKSIPEGAIRGRSGRWIDFYVSTLRAASAHYGLELDLSRPVKDFTPAQRDLLFYGAESPQFRRHFPDIEQPSTVHKGRFEGLATNLLRRHAEHLRERANDSDYSDKLDELVISQACPDCAGTRLRAESRAVTVHGSDIAALSRLPLLELDAWLEALPARLTADKKLVAEPVVCELRKAIARLIEVGAGYLALERASPTLSAGEAQRLRLASLLDSALSGVLYVFDEPTIGLHHRDTRRLIDVLRRLRDLENTVVVIEHDLEIIAAADHVIDFGPGAGKYGGEVVACGAPAEIVAEPRSITGDFLAGRRSLPILSPRRRTDGAALIVRGAREHNLQDITVRIPLGALVAVTGVSGSGKSTLAFDVLDRALRQRLHGLRKTPGAHEAIEGVQHLDRVVTIDQAHIGRLPRSNAATYSDAFTPIREAFASTPEARRLGLSARHFSFNVPGGRCERCEGAGILAVTMQLLPDAEVRCPTCRGRRFTRETLAVRYRDHDIAQVLELTVDEALALFEDVPAARARLQVLSEVGLGYLQLGQPAPTLSGGEAQRMKLAKELGRRGAGRALYLLDEPTTGLHLADTARLLGVLQSLVDAGNSVVVVEHNLEVVKAADWIIDLGPEGGAAGGRLVAQGTPEQVSRVAGSFTGQGLRRLLGSEAHGRS